MDAYVEVCGGENRVGRITRLACSTCQIMVLLLVCNMYGSWPD